MIISWIVNSLNPEIASSVLYMNYAFDVWRDLEDRFAQSNALRIFQIKHTISSLAQDQNSVSTYFIKLKALWNELPSYSPLPIYTCGGIKKMLEKEQIMLYNFCLG